MLYCMSSFFFSFFSFCLESEEIVLMGIKRNSWFAQTKAFTASAFAVILLITLSLMHNLLIYF